MNYHPVWNVYDLQRTARLNVKYYSRIVGKYKKLNTTIDFILVICAPSSALASIAYWKTSSGTVLWTILSIIAALTASIKPLLQLSGKISKIEKLISGYQVLEHDLYNIHVQVRQRKCYDPELQTRFALAIERKKALIEHGGTDTINQKLRNHCENEVLRELPPSEFYVPQEDKNER